MWALLLWLNQKLMDGYKKWQKRKQDKKQYMLRQGIDLSSRQMPEYLKRDIGLPPYGANDHDLY